MRFLYPENVWLIEAGLRVNTTSLVDTATVPWQASYMSLCPPIGPDVPDCVNT